MSYFPDSDDTPFDLDPPRGPDLTSPIPGAEVILDLRTATRDEWLDARKQGIGASDSAAALGESPYGNRYSLWAEKTGRVPPRTESEAMELGSLLEPLVASLFAKRTGLTLRKCDHMYRHPEHPWMLATPDYYVTKPDPVAPEHDYVSALVQIKTTNEYNADDWADGPPRHVYLQMQHEMVVTGIRDAYAVALIGGNRLVYHRVTLDEDAAEAMVGSLAAFWSTVEGGNPPPITAQDKDAVGAMYPESSERTITLPADAEGFVLRYRLATAQIAELERERDLASTCLKAMLGTASEGYAGDHRVVWRTQERKSFVVPAKTIRAFNIRSPKAPKGVA